ncbi:hypothetical protein [Roseibacillus ishigakijimensis]|uniref:Lipoprotein n=1 Tax=Roseibacillus ishigakijimensis TaxID=454146 RepID=A0A934VM89_9BACT|nr:hypothetical protein [Roseibacillus ishigakijimensis]MBK1835504.1 hypothetical protein [Roseibacillus ishigakijimensis]
MKPLLLAPLFLCGLSLLSCRQEKEVTISETRPLTSLDEDPAINASSDEQFLPPEVLAQVKASGQSTGGGTASAEGSAWQFELPAEDWTVVPKTAMREVNLTFGEGEQQGEIYLSVSGGGIKPNADRWFRQFGAEPQPIAELERVEFLGESAYLVSAQGRYEPGMGRPGEDGQGLLGVLVESEGRIVTVKMIGPEEEVTQRREQFLAFLASLARK